MQTNLASRLKLRCAFFFAIFLIANLSQPEVVAQERLSRPQFEKRLAEAVQLIDTNPKLAERKLKQLNSHSAEAYLAYLYLARKVTVPRPLTRVDSLMHKAMAGAQPGGDLQQIKHYHYKDMEKLLRNLRFIACDVETPMSIAKDYPVEFFKAFQPWWGSSMDAWPQFGEVDKRYRLESIPQMCVYFQNQSDIEGLCEGTIRSMFHRRSYLMSLKAELAPQLFLTKAAAKEIDPHLNDFLYKWSTYELWNKEKYEEWRRLQKPTVAALAAYYQKNYKMQPAKATLCATRALDSMSTATIGNYSSGELAELKPGSLYALFRQKHLSLAQVQQHFANQKPTEEELVQALRMAILNGHDITIAEWLIKEGAPIKGGAEPPLFSAVLRPEVVQLLLKSGADANEKNTIGKTALIQAAQYGSLESCKRLIAAGAQLNHQMGAPFAYGAENPQQDYLPDYTCYNTGNRTALMYAAKYAGYPVIKYLLDAGADSTAIDSAGETAKSMIGTNKKLNPQQKLLLTKAFIKNAS